MGHVTGTFHVIGPVDVSACQDRSRLCCFIKAISSLVNGIFHVVLDVLPLDPEPFQTKL